ncbi:MAG: magnesium transporter [Pseudomonadota bacterium]
MNETTTTKISESRLERLTRALDSGAAGQVRYLLTNLHAAEIAELLESFPHGPREILWELVDPDDRGEILVHLNEEVRAGLIREMETHDLVAATEGLDPDDLVDLLQDLPDAVTREIMRVMDKQNRVRLEAILHYPEDSAGGLMNVDVITVRADVTLDVVLRYLRLHKEMPETTDTLFVVDRNDRYRGSLPLTSLLTNDPDLMVAAVMHREVKPILASTPDVEVARLFENHDLVTAPVVNDDNKLLGRITIDDVVDVIRDDAEHSLLSMAGLDEEDDTFAPIVKSARRRAVWLGINLATAFLASWVIGRFQATIEQVVALAVLMPIVASMGGIAGSQTLIIVIRGLALGQLGASNARWLMYKELSVAIINGIGWALVVAVISALWFHNTNIGVIIAVALIVNLFCAALAGLSIPFFLKRVNIDPAHAGSVILTTVTDVVGFLVFLGLGTLFLL